MGLFSCDMLETRGYLIPEYYCRYSREKIDSRTAQDICMSERRENCTDYQRAHSILPWNQ